MTTEIVEITHLNRATIEDAWIQCGRFRGRDKVDIFDQTEIHEHLPKAVDSIELFLKKHAFKSAEFSGMRKR